MFSCKQIFMFLLSFSFEGSNLPVLCVDIYTKVVHWILQYWNVLIDNIVCVCVCVRAHACMHKCAWAEANVFMSSIGFCEEMVQCNLYFFR